MLYCSFCHQNQEELSKIHNSYQNIVEKDGVNICRRCVEKLSNDYCKIKFLRKNYLNDRYRFLQCSMCCKRRKKVEIMLYYNGITICDSCLRMCDNILKQFSFIEKSWGKK